MMESIKDKPLYALEEQLVRQKGILANCLLVRKLPDKGAKLKESVSKLEAEIQKRKLEVRDKPAYMSLKDVGVMEWTLSGSRTVSDTTASNNTLLDSDDDEVEMNDDEEQRALKIVAASQISQRLPKPILQQNVNHVSSDEAGLERLAAAVSENNEEQLDKRKKLDKYVARMVHVDSSKPPKEKYVPGKSLKSTPDGSGSPAADSSTSKNSSSGRSTPREKGPKWDECLLPPSHTLESVKLLPMDQSIQISEEKYKKEEETLAAAQSTSRKKYAYDKLREQGLLGTFTVEMQVTRPVRTDIGDDDLEDDLSDDQITEDSESEDDDDAGSKVTSEANKKTSKDLSNLLNSSLKLQ